MTWPAGELPAGAVVSFGDGSLLIGPATVGYVASALAGVERQCRLDGIRPPEAWLHLRDAAAKAAAFAAETAKVRKIHVVPESAQIGPSRVVDAGRVAEVLSCSPQWARALLRRGDFATARRAGRSWLVDEDELTARVIRQSRRDGAAA